MLLGLLENDGLALKQKTAREYSSPCPACGGRDRLVIHADTGRYWCRQCGKSGDALQYLRDFHGMTFRDAASAVGKNIAPLAVKHVSHFRQEEKPVRKPQAQSWRDQARRLIDHAHDSLKRNREVLTWLQAERGITLATAERFSLGWLDRNHYLSKETWCLEPDGKKLLVPSGLLIPWQNKRIRIRRDNPGEYGRYHVLTGSSVEPLTIGEAYETTCVIVESELDAILLAQVIRRKVFIIALGSAQIKPDADLLEKLTLCPVILVALDTDQAGGKAAIWWLQNVPSAFRTLTPSRYGTDLTEAFLHGLDLNEWLSASLELCVEECLAPLHREAMQHTSYDQATVG